MVTKEMEDFQKQTLEMFRAQQEAYLKAVKAWQDAMSAATTAAPAPAPQFDNVPTPAEVAEAGFAFASKLLADQSRFLEELGHAMTTARGAGKGKKGA